MPGNDWVCLDTNSKKTLGNNWTATSEFTGESLGEQLGNNWGATGATCMCRNYPACPHLVSMKTPSVLGPNDTAARPRPTPPRTGGTQSCHGPLQLLKSCRLSMTCTMSPLILDCKHSADSWGGGVGLERIYAYSKSICLIKRYMIYFQITRFVEAPAA